MQTDDTENPRDPALTLQLRTMYRPPTDAAYWDGLEARIMDRVLRGDESPRTSGVFASVGGWWEPFAQWTRVGGLVAAAALAFTVWGLLATNADKDRQLYEEAVEAISTPLDSTGRPVSDAPREKTVPELFRY
jgi:hypothetical protein